MPFEFVFFSHVVLADHIFDHLESIGSLRYTGMLKVDTFYYTDSENRSH